MDMICREIKRKLNMYYTPTEWRCVCGCKLQIQSYRFDFNHIGILYFQHKRAIFSVKTITFPVSVVFGGSGSGTHFIKAKGGKMENAVASEYFIMECFQNKNVHMNISLIQQ